MIMNRPCLPTILAVTPVDGARELNFERLRVSQLEPLQ
jgi:hypothetical protein